MQAMFDFEQAPPISVPFRFFLAGPPFGAAAGLLLAWLGNDAFASRWSPPLLAVVHLLTLGFMLQIMSGALLQIMPVAVGANVRRSPFLASVVQPGIVIGTLLLVWGFVQGDQAAFQWAIPVLCVPLAVYVAVCGYALFRTDARGATVWALRGAIFGLVPTLALGAMLASIFGWGKVLPMMALVASHVAWGLLGWGLMLVIAVAYLVVPMFQLTPPYRPRLAFVLPAVLLASLVVWTLLELFLPLALALAAVGLVVAICVAAFALITLDLQRRRRRSQADVTLSFWRLGMGMLLLAAGTGGAILVGAGAELTGRLEILVGILMVAGVFMSLINGMLYKIVPFLNWLHLQKRIFPAPNMKRMMSERSLRGHFWLHGASVLGLLASVFLPVLVRPSGLLFAASCLWLEWNLVGGVRVYLRHTRGDPSASNTVG